jgi:glycosyltransferase involved in cell wall biosynthesis
MNLTRSEIVQQYESADMIVLPSTIEGFGLPILEANAVGRPVVTSNLSSMPEVAGDAACLVDPYDVESIRAGITRVLKEVQYRDDLVTNGLLNVQRFRANLIAAEYLRLYRRVIGGTPLTVERVPASTVQVQ